MSQHQFVIDSIGKWADVLPEASITAAADALQSVEQLRWLEETVYPEKDDVFRALKLTPPDRVKVVIIGQDPYHEAGQANGLAFSVNAGVRIPPSLRNIIKELHDDIGCQIPESGDLTPWAEQGVLLLNSVLTVEEGKAGSHAKVGWQGFTESVFRHVLRSENEQEPVVMAWGRYAAEVLSKALVGSNWNPFEKPNHLLIYSSHPSPLSASRETRFLQAFIGSRPFSKANEWLVEHGKEPINWEL